MRWRKSRRGLDLTSPRVQIHTPRPWYWRAAALGLLVGLAAAAAAWIYDAGQRFAGFDRSELQNELSRAKRELDLVREELEQVRAVANAADARIHIERTAQQKLAQQVRALERENARAREELATFESLISAEARSTSAPTIHRFRVEPDVLPGEYRYRLLVLTPTTRRDRDFNGRLELVVHLQEGGENAMISFPEPGAAGAAAFRLSFKYFGRVEGTFRVSPKAKVDSVQVRIYESGAKEPRATHSVAL